MSSFENVWKANRNKYELTKDLAKAMYEAGERSKLLEVVELKRKLDAIHSAYIGDIGYEPEWVKIIMSSK